MYLYIALRILVLHVFGVDLPCSSVPYFLLQCMKCMAYFKVSLVHSSLYFITICAVRKIADGADK